MYYPDTIKNTNHVEFLKMMNIEYEQTKERIHN